MNDIRVNPYGVTFGNVQLARGGAEYMAQNLVLKNATQFITKQAKNATTVLVSDGHVEVIPPQMNMVLNILGFFRRDKGKHFIDVFFEDHGQRGAFRIPRNVPNKDIYEYGKGNTKFSLAKIVANEMENNWKWGNLISYQSPLPEIKAVINIEGYRDPIHAKDNAEAIKKLCTIA